MGSSLTIWWRTLLTSWLINCDFKQFMLDDIYIFVLIDFVTCKLSIHMPNLIWFIHFQIIKDCICECQFWSGRNCLSDAPSSVTQNSCTSNKSSNSSFWTKVVNINFDKYIVFGMYNVVQHLGNELFVYSLLSWYFIFPQYAD